MASINTMFSMSVCLIQYRSVYGWDTITLTMTNEERNEIAKEVLTNMDLTREQYLELCELADELDLELIPDIYFDD